MSPPRPPRVILGATSLADAEATLALATALAAEAGAEVRGLMVEDEEVMALSRVSGMGPAMRLVAPGGSPLALPGPERLRAALARDAALFERLLTETAERVALPRSFGRTRGRLAASLAAAADPGDVLVVPTGPFRGALRDVVLLGTAAPDTLLPGLARATAARLNRPLRRLPLPEAVSEPAGSVLLATLDRLGSGTVLFAELSVIGPDFEHLLQRTRCTHVLHA